MMLLNWSWFAPLPGECRLQRGLRYHEGKVAGHPRVVVPEKERERSFLRAVLRTETFELQVDLSSANSLATGDISNPVLSSIV